MMAEELESEGGKEGEENRKKEDTKYVRGKEARQETGHRQNSSFLINLWSHLSASI